MILGVKQNRQTLCSLGLARNAADRFATEKKNIETESIL